MISGLFGFFSNCYVVTVIALYKPMHKQLTNIYITNQSVIDATVALFLFFTTLFEDDKRKRTPGYGPDEAICRLWYTKVSVNSKRVVTKCMIKGKSGKSVLTMPRQQYC